MEGPPNDQLGGDPIEMAGLFEGDIAGVNVQEMVKYAKATDKKTTKSSKTSKGSKGSKGSKDQVWNDRDCWWQATFVFPYFFKFNFLISLYFDQCYW